MISLKFNTMNYYLYVNNLNTEDVTSKVTHLFFVCFCKDMFKFLFYYFNNIINNFINYNKVLKIVRLATMKLS